MPEKENEKTEKHICSSPSPIEQETWITPAEASLAMDLNLNTVIKRVEKGKITAKIVSPQCSSDYLKNSENGKITPSRSE